MLKRSKLLALAFVFAPITSAYSYSLPCAVSYSLPYGSQIPTSLSFSPNGKYLATVNSPNDVTIFTVTNGVLDNGTSYALPSHYSDPIAVTFSPDGKYLAIADSLLNSVTLFKFNNGVLSGGTDYHLPSGALFPNSVAFSPDGKYLVIANAYIDPNTTRGTVTVCEFSNGIITGMVNYDTPFGSIDPFEAVFSPDGSVLCTVNTVSSSGPGDVTMFTADNGVLSNGTSYALPINSSLPESVAFSPDGKYVATTNSNSNDVSIITLNNSTSSYPLPADAMRPQSGKFSPDGKYFVTANLVSSTGSGNVVIFRVDNEMLSNGTSFALPAGSVEPYAVAFSPNGKYFATVNYKSNDISVFRLACYIKALMGSMEELVL